MNQYALLAGISRYNDDQISDLQFAAKDVLAFRDKLIDVLGFAGENVHVFTDKPGDSFARNDAIIACFSRICRRLGPEDTFVFYFAGHGVEKPDGVYLMTANTNSYSPALIKTTSIPVSVLQEELFQTPAANRIFIIDACRNDPEKGRGDSDNLLTDKMSRDLILAAKSRTSDIVQPPCTGILFACTTGERAYEWPDKANGVFSYYLLEAIDQLGGEQGEVDFGVLERMVKNNVMRWCRDNLPRDKMQRPWLETIGGVPIIGKKRHCGSLQPKLATDVPENSLDEKPLFGSLALTCPESAVSIAIGNLSFTSKAGVQQMVYNLPAGMIDVSAKKEGFEPWAGQVEIKSDKIASIFIDLKPLTKSDEPAPVVKRGKKQPHSGFMEKFSIRIAGIRYIVIPGKSVSLGRNSPRFTGNPVGLSLPDISRRHGTIFVKDGKWFYQDTDQCTNGTLVNGKLVRNAVELRDGDQLAFGRFADPDDTSPLQERCGETINVNIFPLKDIPCLKVTVAGEKAWEIKDDRKKAYILIGGGVRIGRSKKNAIFIEDPSVLPEHMDIVVAEGRYYIDKAKPASKILVNESPVSRRQALQPGDRVRVGSKEFLIEVIR